MLIEIGIGIELWIGVGTEIDASAAALGQGRGSSETIRFHACTGLKSAFPGVPTEVGVPRNGPATSAVAH